VARRQLWWTLEPHRMDWSLGRSGPESSVGEWERKGRGKLDLRVVVACSSADECRHMPRLLMFCRMLLLEMILALLIVTLISV
jgi:hypothetical protein